MVIQILVWCMAWTDIYMECSAMNRLRKYSVHYVSWWWFGCTADKWLQMWLNSWWPFTSYFTHFLWCWGWKRAWKKITYISVLCVWQTWKLVYALHFIMSRYLYTLKPYWNVVLFVWLTSRCCHLLHVCHRKYLLQKS